MMENVKIAVVSTDEDLREFIAATLSYCVNRKVTIYSEINELIGNEILLSDTDLVILDLPLKPFQAGELIRSVTSSHKNPICIVASENLADEMTARRNGADGFLAKPFTMNDLFKIVETVIVGVS